jgi:hypothetical protein
LEGVDFTMLDFILDLFIKYLALGLINEGTGTNNHGSPGNGGGNRHYSSPESHTPMHDEQGANDVLTKKKNMIVVMSDLMQLLSPETNIR